MPAIVQEVFGIVESVINQAIGATGCIQRIAAGTAGASVQVSAVSLRTRTLGPSGSLSC